MTLDGDFTPEEFGKARRAEDTFAPVHVDAQVYRDLEDDEATEFCNRCGVVLEDWDPAETCCLCEMAQEQERL